MAKPEEFHEYYLVEVCDIDSTSGRRGKRHLRPCEGQDVSVDMLVRCPRELRNFPLKTKFKIWAKLTDREGGMDFLSSWHGYKYYGENDPGFENPPPPRSSR